MFLYPQNTEALDSVHQIKREYHPKELIQTHFVVCQSAPSPRPLPQAGGEGKGEGVPSSVKGFIAFVLVPVDKTVITIAEEA